MSKKIIACNEVYRRNRNLDESRRLNPENQHDVPHKPSPYARRGRKGPRFFFHGVRASRISTSALAFYPRTANRILRRTLSRDVKVTDDPLPP
jgi:hypothetical protein